MGLVISLLIGLIAGALAGYFVKGSGFGLIGDTLVGLVGGLVGGLVFGLLWIQDNGSFIGQIILGFVGAVVLLLIVKIFVKGNHI